MHHNDNLEARNLISNAIKALSPVNVYVLMWKALLFTSMHTEIKKTPNTAVGKTGYK
jgi:hypothetical protein